MEFVFAFMGVALWALIPGSIAHRKGRSFAAYYFLSFVISPLITLIVVLCVENRNDFGFDMSYTADERATALSEVPQNVIDSCQELRGNQKALKKYLNQRVKFSSITPAQASVLYTEYKLVHPIDLQALTAPTIPLNLPDIPVTNQPDPSPTPPAACPLLPEVRCQARQRIPSVLCAVRFSHFQRRILCRFFGHFPQHGAINQTRSL